MLTKVTFLFLTLYACLLLLALKRQTLSIALSCSIFAQALGLLIFALFSLLSPFPTSLQVLLYVLLLGWHLFNSCMTGKEIHGKFNKGHIGIKILLGMLIAGLLAL